MGEDPALDRQERLQLVIGTVARQQPALRWIVGERPDGTVVIATDVASGWIPPGVQLPGGVVVLEPARRTGSLNDWVGPLTHSATYHPGDRIDRYSTPPATAGEAPFAVVDLDEDLGWRLSEATRLQEDLPRIFHTLAKAGAAQTGVVEAEMDVLRVHAQTAVQSMLSSYPHIPEAAAVSGMLVGAAEAMAAGRRTLAGYHMAWYELFADRRWG